MSNPEKRWSWGGAIGRSSGTAMAGATAGFITGSLGGPLGAPIGAAVFGAVGFCGGLIGAGLGHWWDDLDRAKESFGSGALFTLVVGGPFAIFGTLLLACVPALTPEAHVVGNLPAEVLIGFFSIVASAAKSLLDDLHYVYMGGSRSRTF